MDINFFRGKESEGISGLSVWSGQNGDNIFPYEHLFNNIYWDEEDKLRSKDFEEPINILSFLGKYYVNLCEKPYWKDLFRF